MLHPSHTAQLQKKKPAKFQSSKYGGEMSVFKVTMHLPKIRGLNCYGEVMDQ